MREIGTIVPIYLFLKKPKHIFKPVRISNNNSPCACCNNCVRPALMLDKSTAPRARRVEINELGRVVSILLILYYKFINYNLLCPPCLHFGFDIFVPCAHVRRYITCVSTYLYSIEGQAIV